MGRHRGHNEGSITLIKDKGGKVVAYRPQLSLPDGGRRSFPRVKSKKEAQRLLDEAKSAVMQGRLGPGGNQTVSKYLDDWLVTLKPSIKPSTYDTYKRNVRRVSNQIGKIHLHVLHPADVQNCYNALGTSGLSAQTIQRVHRTLHKALKDALRFDLVVRNPTEGATLPRVAHVEMSWYTSEQLERLFTSTDGDRFHALWVVLGTLGLRLGEGLGLKWEDIDFRRGTLTVQRTLQRDRDGGGLQFYEPKTAKSRRTLDLPAETRAALQAHKERQAFERRGIEYLSGSAELVFSTAIDTPLDQGRIHIHWSAAVKKANIPHYRIHDLRHSVATHLIMAGMNAMEVAEILGHSSPTLVHEVYGHVAPSSRGRAASVMDAMLDTQRRAL